MRMLRPAFQSSVPCLALVAAATALAPDAPLRRSPEVSGPEVSDPGMAAIIHVQRGRRRFTPDDIPAIVAGMRRAGHVNFVCWMDPSTGGITIETDEGETPHFDIKPGECPNHIEIEEISTFRTGILGNAFDVTQIDLGTMRLSIDLFSVNEGEVEPVATGIEDVETPFNAELCDCHAGQPDDVLDATADFDRQEVIDTFGLDVIPNGTLVPLRISGMLGEGRGVFSARDCVKITNHSN